MIGEFGGRSVDERDTHASSGGVPVLGRESARQGRARRKKCVTSQSDSDEMAHFAELSAPAVTRRGRAAMLRHVTTHRLAALAAAAVLACSAAQPKPQHEAARTPPAPLCSAAPSASSPAAHAEHPLAWHTRFGCFATNDCHLPDATCEPAALLGKCSCKVDADCSPSETCYAGRCELRCAANANVCPRGGACGPHYDFCVDPRQASSETFDLMEWAEKAAAGVPGHEPRFLHATYDEWDGTTRHLRVSFRGDGSYVIELDGISGWNRSLSSGKKGNARGRELLRTGVVRGQGKTPGIPSLNAPSCAEPLSPFRAELVLVAEFATLKTYRGVWTHPKCPGFPGAYVDAIWSFVNEQTGGALEAFDRKQWGELPPVGPTKSADDAARSPCWPGQSFSAGRCSGRPSACPAGFTPADDGCAKAP